MTANGEEKAHSLHQIVQNVAALVANGEARGLMSLMSHVEVSGRNSKHVRTGRPRLRPLRKRSQIGDPWPSLPPHHHHAAHHRRSIWGRGEDRISAKMRRRRETLASPITRRRRRKSGQLAVSLSPPPLSGRIVDPLGGSFTMDALASEIGDRVVGTVVTGVLHYPRLLSLRITQTGGLAPGRSPLLARP